MPLLAGISLALAGCGGGGNTSIASTPPPPPPAAVAATVGAPATAAAAATPPAPTATAGGPTIAAPGSTVFPLIETVWTRTPSAETADPATIAAGATLSLDPANKKVTLNVANASVGATNAVLRQDSLTAEFYTANVGSNHVDIFLDTATPSGALSWTAYGNWAVYARSANSALEGKEGFFVTGYRTPAGSMPTSGTAAYSGLVIGEVVFPGNATTNGINNLDGKVDLTANFATGAISGALTNMMSHSFEGPSLPWNSVSITASFGIGQSGFSGITAVTSTPGNSVSLSATATGTINGAFFGPSANEVGAVWTLFDGTRAAIGSFGAQPNPSGAGAWDY